MRVWDLSNKDWSWEMSIWKTFSGAWVSFDLNHRRCDHSMTVTRHKGGCVFAQRWNMPSTLKDATYPCIPLQMGENIKTPTKNKPVRFFCVFFERKKTSLPWNHPFSKKFRCLSHGPSSEFSPRTAAPSAGGPGGLGRENPNGATSTFGPSGACTKKGQGRWIVTCSKWFEVFFVFCCWVAAYFLLFLFSIVVPLVGYVSFGLWFVLLRMGFVQLKVSWIRRFTSALIFQLFFCLQTCISGCCRSVKDCDWTRTYWIDLRAPDLAHTARIHQIHPSIQEISEIPKLFQTKIVVVKPEDEQNSAWKTSNYRIFDSVSRIYTSIMSLQWPSRLGDVQLFFSALSCEDTSLIKCAWKIFNWNRWFHAWVCWSLSESLQKGCLHLFNENSDNKYLDLFLVGIPSAKLQSLSSWGCCWVLANTAPFVRCNVLVVDTWPGVPWTKQKLCVGPVPRIFRCRGLEMIEVRCRFIEKVGDFASCAAPRGDEVPLPRSLQPCQAYWRGHCCRQQTAEEMQKWRQTRHQVRKTCDFGGLLVEQVASNPRTNG